MREERNPFARRKYDAKASRNQAVDAPWGVARRVDCLVRGEVRSWLMSSTVLRKCSGVRLSQPNFETTSRAAVIRSMKFHPIVRL